MKSKLTLSLIVLLSTLSTLTYASTCIEELSKTGGYALVVAQSACAGDNKAELADSCLKELNSPINNYALAIAGPACAGRNTAKHAKECLEGVTKNTGFGLNIASMVCGFNMTTEEALGCLAQNLWENKNISLVKASEKCFEARQ